MRRVLALIALAACAPVPASAEPPPAPAEPPVRVLSMNLCTDQLAMLVAAPGQLVSVSHLARDPRASAMAAEAAALPANRGLAEDILRMRPDLVLAGSYSTPVTVAMLRRLGLPVAVFAPETDMAGIRANIERMGAVLGRQAEAQAIVARFDADLAALAARPATGGRAAVYEAGGYAAGDASLAGAILAEAGLANVADELGLGHGGFLPLERLVRADPDLVVTGRPHPRASRAEEVLTHPALRALSAGAGVGAGPGTRAGAMALTDADWICGTPHVLRAVARLREAAR